MAIAPVGGTRSPGPGKIISRLLSEPQDLLATLVLGNSFANAGIVAVALWLASVRGWPLPAVLAVLLALILIWRRSGAQNAGRARAGTVGLARRPAHAGLLQNDQPPACAAWRKRLTNLSLRACPQPRPTVAGGSVRRGIPGIARNGLSARGAGGGRKGNHPANHQSGPPPAPAK